MDDIGIIFAQMSREIGDRRLLSSIGPTAATHLFKMWNIGPGRRIAANQWSMELQSPDSKEFFGAAQRNIKRARDRLALEQARPRAGAEEGIRDHEGNIILGPSGDELIPPVPR